MGAGFDIQMSLKNLDVPSAQDYLTPGMFPAPQSNCVTGFNLKPGPTDGNRVKCVVHAVAGTTNDCNGPTHTYYWWSKRRATYLCTGSTMVFWCNYQGTEDITGQCTPKDQQTVF